MQEATDRHRIAALQHAVEMAKMGMIPRESDAIFAEADRTVKMYFNNKQ
jgi:hypothetical protein